MDKRAEGQTNDSKTRGEEVGLSFEKKLWALRTTHLFYCQADI
jgi:hypothetical protein